MLYLAVLAAYFVYPLLWVSVLVDIVTFPYLMVTLVSFRDRSGDLHLPNAAAFIFYSLLLLFGPIAGPPYVYFSVTVFVVGEFIAYMLEKTGRLT